MTISDVLAAIAARLSVRTAWTKFAEARRKNGSNCKAKENQAVCWCLGGAVVAETKNTDLQRGVLLMLAGAIKDGPHAVPLNVVTAWNDDAKTRYIDMLELIRRTQQVASKES